MTHIGVRIRLSVKPGIIFEADSDLIHYLARGCSIDDACNPACAPACSVHGWKELTAGLIDRADLKVEVKAVVISELPTDDDGPSEYCPCPCSECSGCLGA